MAILQKGELSNSTIGERSFFEGRFMIKGSLRIDGKFEGEMLEVDQLVIGPKGKVKTNIKATNVMVEGIVIGNITAKNRVYLLPQSKILGDIKTPELIVQNGVILEGKCNVSNNLDSPSKEYFEKIYKENEH
jgi:cytoskeletal protein CcmA (bactofilin family)